MIKTLARLAAVSVALAAVILSAAGASAVTVFTVSVAQSGDTADVSVTAEWPPAVSAGGLHLRLSVPAQNWRLDGDSVETRLKNADTGCDAATGEAWLLWDTAGGGASMPQNLLSVRLERLTEQADPANIVFSVREYYDATPGMNDLPYRIQTPRPDAGKAVDAGGGRLLPVLLICGALAAAGAGWAVHLHRLRGSRRRNAARRKKGG